MGQYASYIEIVAHLGQRKDWWSMVQYEDAYRGAQSVVAFAWGKYFCDLRDTSRKESKPQSQARGMSKFGLETEKQRPEGRGRVV